MIPSLAKESMLGLQARFWPWMLTLSVCVAFLVVVPKGPSTAKESTVLPSLIDEDSRTYSRRSILSAGAFSSDQPETYALVIDAGSSGCRIHVYKLKWQAGKKYPYVDLPDKCVILRLLFASKCAHEILSTNTVRIPTFFCDVRCRKLKVKPGLSTFLGKEDEAGNLHNSPIGTIGTYRQTNDTETKF